MELPDDRVGDARRGIRMFDPYMAGKMADYTRSEIARSRGHRNWKQPFNRYTSKFSR